jgi:hypothetical protein
MTVPDLPDGMCQRTIQISNTHGELDIIILEPWVDQIPIQVGDIVEIRGIGPVDRAGIEVDEIERGRVVWGWPGALLHVSVNGEPLETFSSRTVPPGLPAGMTFKDFLTLTRLIDAPDKRRS